jgi:hypothetical protein
MPLRVLFVDDRTQFREIARRRSFGEDRLEDFRRQTPVTRFGKVNCIEVSVRPAPAASA